MKKNKINLTKEKIEKILIKINPKIKPYLKKKNNFVDNGLLDSLMIIKLIHEIESITNKKIKIGKINRESFISTENI